MKMETQKILEKILADRIQIAQRIFRRLRSIKGDYSVIPANWENRVKQIKREWNDVSAAGKTVANYVAEVQTDFAIWVCNGAMLGAASWGCSSGNLSYRNTAEEFIEKNLRDIGEVMQRERKEDLDRSYPLLKKLLPEYWLMKRDLPTSSEEQDSMNKYANSLINGFLEGARRK